MTVIANIGRDDYKFDIQPCVAGFYRAVNARKFEAAKAYVNTIDNAFRDYLIYHMNKTIDEKTKLETVILTNDTIKTVLERGILILQPKTLEEKTTIKAFAENSKEISSFGRPSGEIVLKVGKPFKTTINISQISTLGEAAYVAENYEECINQYMKILKYGTLKSLPYARIGLSHYQLGNLPLAFNYLTVANDMCKRDREPYNFDDKIAEIRQLLITSNDIEKQEETNISTIKDYGLAYMKEMLELLDNGVDVEEIAIRFELNGSDIARLYLVAAEHSYQYEQYEAGDSYIQSLVSTPNMDETILTFANEIIRNRKLYHHIPSGDNGNRVLARLNGNKTKDNSLD